MSDEIFPIIDDDDKIPATLFHGSFTHIGEPQFHCELGNPIIGDKCKDHPNEHQSDCKSCLANIIQRFLNFTLSKTGTEELDEILKSRAIYGCHSPGENKD